MRKSYHYKNLSFPVADVTEVYFTVEFISDGNTGPTIINVPGPNDAVIENAGTALIGKGLDLRGDTTISVSDITNLAPMEDEIRILYKINGLPVQLHVNLKSEEERPMIILHIKFPVL